MKLEFSAGGIVVNDQKQVLVIETKPLSRSASITDQNHFGFPKGKINKDEGAPDAALREVREETGVEAEILSKVGDSRYIYTHQNQKISKGVTIYLMRYLSGNLKDHNFEVEQVLWLPYDEALKLLTFPQDRQLLEKAFEILNR